VTGPKYLFLLPGTGRRWWSGGTATFLNLARLVAEHRRTEVIVYADNDGNHRSLDDALQDASVEDVWVFTTGVDVQMLGERLAGRRQVYYAMESGWRLDMSVDVPILSASRAGLAQLSRMAPANPLYLLPPALGPDVVNRGGERDVDVLVLKRKSTSYLLDELVPALMQECAVHVIDGFLPRTDLLDLFNRAKLYLYDSDACFGDGIEEGFGLQPLEALVSGCAIVTNLSGGMADYLDPGVNCQLLRRDLHEDIALCRSLIVEGERFRGVGDDLRAKYSDSALSERIARLLPQLEAIPARDETGRRAIARRLERAVEEGNQPLHTAIRERDEILKALREEMLHKVAERDDTITAIQAELHAKVGERDRIIRTLQSELQAKVGERDAIIQGLQAELHAKVGERDAIIHGLQAELHASVGERDEIIHSLQQQLHGRASR
jgi:hypothetical protein